MRPGSVIHDPRITVVRVSEKDILSLGRWPVTDEILAQALTVLLKESPRAIGLDIFRDIPVPPGSYELRTEYLVEGEKVDVITVDDVIVTVRKNP